MVIGYAILVAQCSDNHQIRTIDENGKRAPVLLEHVDDAISQRQELPVLLDAWAAACGRNADQPMLVIVATAGGASRAALWTASVMHQIERAVGPLTFRQARGLVERRFWREPWCGSLHRFSAPRHLREGRGFERTNGARLVIGERAEPATERRPLGRGVGGRPLAPS